MATDNNTIVTSVYLAATNEYQQRIPDPTQSSLQQTMAALFDPMNKKYLNQFIDILVNRIAFTYVRSKMWDNPLAVFKGAKVNYGSTIQEVAPKWIKAHSYDDEAETLLKLHRPEAQAWYHSQNRRDQYSITINYDELRTAFTDEYGLNNLISSIMAVPISSDNYDEYRIMVQLIGLYENNWGFFKHKLSAFPDDVDSAKEMLKQLRTYGGKLRFPSTLYNAQAITDIPVFVNSNSELVLITTPEAQASLDVDALAVLFNMEKADVQQRIVIVDEFPIPDAVALLTTEDFFVCNDTLYENTSFYNPQRLDTTYFLNHWGIYSVSPFVPAILFTTAAGTTVPKVTETVTGITVTMGAATVDAGGEVPVTVKLTGTLNPADTDGVKVAPDAATYEVSAEVPGDGADATPVKLNYRTRVDEYGVLHVAKTIPSGTVITVKATSTYQNPSGATPATLTGSATVTVN